MNRTSVRVIRRELDVTVTLAVCVCGLSGSAAVLTWVPTPLATGASPAGNCAMTHVCAQAAGPRRLRACSFCRRCCACRRRRRACATAARSRTRRHRPHDAAPCSTASSPSAGATTNSNDKHIRHQTSNRLGSQCCLRKQLLYVCVVCTPVLLKLKPYVAASACLYAAVWCVVLHVVGFAHREVVAARAACQQPGLLQQAAPARSAERTAGAAAAVRFLHRHQYPYERSKLPP